MAFFYVCVCVCAWPFSRIWMLSNEYVRCTRVFGQSSCLSFYPVVLLSLHLVWAYMSCAGSVHISHIFNNSDTLKCVYASRMGRIKRLSQQCAWMRCFYDLHNYTASFLSVESVMWAWALSTRRRKTEPVELSIGCFVLIRKWFLLKRETLNVIEAGKFIDMVEWNSRNIGCVFVVVNITTQNSSFQPLPSLTDTHTHTKSGKHIRNVVIDVLFMISGEA